MHAGWKNIKNLKLLIKQKVNVLPTIYQWLVLGFSIGHLDNISNNLLTGAINYFNDKSNYIKIKLMVLMEKFPMFKGNTNQKDIPTIIVGDENYGEGSSREHAAMEPRHLGVRVVLVKSFAKNS